MLYNRDRMAFTRVFGPGSHIEGEKYIFEKRFRIPMNKHFRYLGPKSEILIYIGVVWMLTHLAKNNMLRENKLESVMNDRDVYLRVDLPLNQRKINN